MSTIIPNIKISHPAATLPFYATDGSAAMDICAVNIPAQGIVLTAIPESEWPPELKALHQDGVPIVQSFVADTGWKVAVPLGHVMKIYSRSGHGFKYNVSLANGTGIIDSDYRGEVKVKLIAKKVNDPKWIHLDPSDSIAQLMILPYPRIEWNQVDDLDSTSRGEGGFGSTTKK